MFLVAVSLRHNVIMYCTTVYMFFRLLHMLPFYHVHGMFISLSCSLFSHSTVLWRERFSVEDCIKWLPSTTVMMGVPTYYR